MNIGKHAAESHTHVKAQVCWHVFVALEPSPQSMATPLPVFTHITCALGMIVLNRWMSLVLSIH